MKKIITTVLSVCLLAHPALVQAQDTNPDLSITKVAKGEKAPFAGILLTPDSLFKIESDYELKIDLLKSEHKFDLERLKLHLDTAESLRGSEKKMYEEIFSSQLRRIETLEQISMNKRPSWVLPVAILSSFVVGAGITVGITYAVNQ